MKRTFLSFALITGLLLAAIPVLAHHSFSAEFDNAKRKTIRGYVTKIDWANPHVWIYLDVVNEKGKKENWGFEMGPPHLVQGQGWKRDTLKIGDEIEVSDGAMAKNGSRKLNARTVTFVKTGLRIGAASSEGQPGQQ